MVPVCLSIDGNVNDICKYPINAMLDSELPISLIKSSMVPDALKSPITDDLAQFKGIND